eukprot:5002039-Pyramimonas_sp.AAC.1
MHENHFEIQSEILQDNPGTSISFANEIRSAMLAPRGGRGILLPPYLPGGNDENEAKVVATPPRVS